MKVLDGQKQEIELRDMDDDGDEVVNVDALSKYAQEQQAKQEAEQKQQEAPQEEPQQD